MTLTQSEAKTVFSYPVRVGLSWLTTLALAGCQTTTTTTAPPPTAESPAPTESFQPGGDLIAPPPPPENSYLAQLPPEVTNQLTTIGVDILVPTYLPANTKLVNHSVGETAGEPYYSLVYRDDQNRCFAIEYAAAGINKISLENKEPINSQLFGKGYSLYHGKFPNGGVGELPTSDLFTDWLAGNGGFYRLVGAGIVTGQDYGQKDCGNITIREAIAVVESLSYLANDIRTLDVIPSESTNAEVESSP